MTPAETTNLIDAAGGDTAFGQLLRLDNKDGWRQRINNWKSRGIPSAVVLEHYDAIRKLKSKIKRAQESA